MSKPVKGNKTKRPASDDRRIKAAHINNLKREVAIVSSRFPVPEGFKVTNISREKIRIKGPGAQAIKLSNSKADVVQAVAERNWDRVASLIPREVPNQINYNVPEVKQIITNKTK